MKVKEKIKPTGESRKTEIAEPGRLRKFDAEVAEKIMGLRQCAWWSTNGVRWGSSCSHADCYPGLWRGDGPCFFVTDIAGAMRVADRMVSDGHIFIIKGDGLRKGDHKPRWTILVDNMPRIDGNDLPEVICYAALAAKNAKAAEVKDEPTL